MQVLLSERTNGLFVSGVHTLHVEVNAAHDYNKIQNAIGEDEAFSDTGINTSGRK
ncbi:uncharacterized protein ARMOST_14861 [Armillaria ostoyae]|uniref:Uncharacterized protein n=1 Tax=Armillaria ostoyae TaxID=47428 RepID=A0A284RRR6_ARMOS|nr:uncharacterized protein ARMOST_14861 [Armillaria ostoyae]